jgi:hypothetical protein
VQNSTQLDNERRIFQLEKQLKELDETKRIEIEAKNIQIQVLQSNIESLKDQICANTERKKDFEEIAKKDDIFIENTKLKIQVIYMTQHTYMNAFYQRKN